MWPWDAIVKSLSLTVEETHMSALLVERSFIDLRNQVTVNGICPLPASDIKFMVADKCKSKVWTATGLTFALWYVSHDFLCIGQQTMPQKASNKPMLADVFCKGCTYEGAPEGV